MILEAPDSTKPVHFKDHYMPHLMLLDFAPCEMLQAVYRCEEIAKMTQTEFHLM